MIIACVDIELGDLLVHRYTDKRLGVAVQAAKAGDVVTVRWTTTARSAPAPGHPQMCEPGQIQTAQADPQYETEPTHPPNTNTTKDHPHTTTRT